MTIKPGKRPVFLNLFQVRFPVSAIQSVLHRFSGVCMVLALPFIIYLLGLSLESADGFALVRALLSSIYFKLLSVFLVWSLAHHLFAGIRYLLIDFEVGIERNAARMSAWLVMVAGGLVALIYLVYLGLLL